ncbi:hypothetical protein JCM15764A_32600 [Geotalea toluenoxydans]
MASANDKARYVSTSYSLSGIVSNITFRIKIKIFELKSFDFSSISRKKHESHICETRSVIE